MRELVGQKVLVTGASTGIGLAACMLLAPITGAESAVGSFSLWSRHSARGMRSRCSDADVKNPSAKMLNGVDKLEKQFAQTPWLAAKQDRRAPAPRTSTRRAR